MSSDRTQPTQHHLHPPASPDDDPINAQRPDPAIDNIHCPSDPPCPQVLPVNDEPPQLGGSLRAQLSCEEGGRVQVTVDYLSATDRDSDDSRLTYMLARSPSRGELQRSGLTTDKFSQQDLLQGHVYYVHSGGSGLHSGAQEKASRPEAGNQF